MTRKKSYRTPVLRERLAREAARILVESGSRNFLNAKRKAAQRLGVSDTRLLPANREIESAIAEYQRLFLAASQPAQLRHLREVGAKAMRLVERFSPRLVGAVLEGTADLHGEVNLHVFADVAEDVGHFLMDRGIPWDLTERRLRDGKGRPVAYPEYRFLAGDVPVGLTVFTGPSAHHAPLSPVDGRPMRRAGLEELLKLLEEEGATGSGTAAG